MNRTILYISLFTATSLLGLSACTVAKLEARLEANPQCKDVVNTKTGALMPCPGSDRAFYVAAGVEAPKPANSAITTSTTSNTPAASVSSTPQSNTECKPQIHKKSGGLIPCLPPE